MVALFLVLNKTEYLDELLNVFVENGVKGATILDSQGMGSALTMNGDDPVPAFGLLRSFLDHAKPYNKTIFTVLESEEHAQRIAKVVNEVVDGIDKPGYGLMFTVPVGQVYGM